MGVINVIFPMVGIVADRFAFTFSLGFCIVVCYLFLKFFKIDLSPTVYKLKIPKGFVLTFVAILVIYSARTIARNPDWHDQMTLYDNDIEHLEESAKAHALLANTLYPMLANEIKSNPGNPQNQANIQKIIYHYKEAIRIDSTYLTSINNLGSAYMNFLADYETAIKYCSKAAEMDRNYLEAHYNLAYSYEALGKHRKALRHYARVIEINTNYTNAYNSFNNLVMKSGEIQFGADLLALSAKKVNDPKNIYLDVANLYTINNYNLSQSLFYFEKAFEYDKSDKVLCSHIAQLYGTAGNFEKARYYRNLCK